MNLPKLPRRPLLTGLLAAPLVAAACSGSKPKPAVSHTTTPPAPTPAPKSTAVTGRGLPPDLLAVMTSLYHGGAVPASPAVVRPLHARTPLKGAVATAGSLGTWGRTPIAVVTAGKDVTLLVKAPTWRVVGGWWPSMKVAAQPTGVRRVLVVGSDARPGEDVGRSRGDSLHIVAFDGQGSGGIVGIPRDSYVPLAIGGVGKINSALSLGGPDKLVETVTSLTGVTVEGYVLTGFAGFQASVDAIGGLRFNAPTTVIGTLGDTLVKKGPNLLNGFRALNFARDRDTVPGGDFGRSANQGLIIMAAAVMARAAGPRAIPGYLTRFTPHVASNLSAEQILTLSSMAFRTSPARFRSKVAPGVGTMRGNQSIVELSPQAPALFADIKDGRLG
ncbi:LCP family protein [Pedococcus sp.]|uniref:LCP family protein n=1 Tax=Pedococcus sp. TaxID=2860345 RepID=UPI002E13E63E|nr:LCP family protein [Pedococcus sp.]